jgi:TetR/AcrR family transcriptional regulator, cholesterol catabolism regulator
MTTELRNSRTDVITAAERLFAERGYHATSMRDLGRALGLHGSSLYSHISSKEDLLVEVIDRGADLFEAAAGRAEQPEGTGAERLARLIGGHLDVVLEHVAAARTYLNEAHALDDDHRRRIIGRRDAYEAHFRRAIQDGIEDGSIRPGTDQKLASILILSILNSVERWYHQGGPLDREALGHEITGFCLTGVGGTG